MRLWTGLPFSPRRALSGLTLLVLAGGVLLIGNEWLARRAGRQAAEADRAATAAAQAAARFRQSKTRYDSAAKGARASVALATTARQRVRITSPKTLEVEGTPVPVVVPPQVVELIARQDTAVAHLTIALLQADTTLAKAEATIAAKDTVIVALKKRVPRFGFRAGLVVGIAAAIGVAAALR